MNDAEWEVWRSRWTGAEGPLPDLRARAAQQAWRHRRANVIFFALFAAGAAVNLGYQDDLVMRWFLIGWGLLLCLGLVWLQRGSRLEESGTPREAVAYLERRIRIEKNLGQVFRWTYAAGLLFVGIHFRDLFGDDWAVKLVARCLLFAVFVVTFAAPWWMRRFTDRQQLEVDRFRRWLDQQQL